MKVLSVEPSPKRRIGGIETALSAWAVALRAAGASVDRVEEPADEQILAADIVHFHGMWESLHRGARKRCVEHGVPFVVSPHGMLEPWALRHKAWKKLPYFHLFERPSLRSAEALLATSALEAGSIGSWFPAAQIRTIPLGIDPSPRPDYDSARRALGWLPNEPIVLFLSRLHEKKGLHLLIEAWRKAAGPGRLVIAGEGDGDYVNPLKSATEDQPSIQWVGARWGAEKWPLLQGADLLCLPSFSENFGLVVLEALLVGTPVLTTPATPWADLGRGLPVTIVQPSVEGLSETLPRCLRSAPAANRDAVHAEVVARFGWTGLASAYLALYRDLIARRHAR